MRKVRLTRVLVEMILLLATEALLSLYTWLVADTINLITDYQAFLRGRGGARDEASPLYVHTVHLCMHRRRGRKRMMMVARLYLSNFLICVLYVAI